MSKGTVLTKTTNNALQYSSAGDNCVELFSKIGASSVEDAKRYFIKAWEEDRETATRILFWARDVRNGSGRRDVSLNILNKYPADFIGNNISQLVNAGYYKDITKFFATNERALAFWATKIKDKDGLACKWAPRDGETAKQLKSLLKFTNKEYRVWIKENSHTIEQYMAGKKEVSATDFNWVPGKAMQKYTKAFDRKYTNEFTSWKDNKDSKANASALWPHEIITSDDMKVAEKQWNNLPNYLADDKTRILPLVDTSSSMRCTAGATKAQCLDIAVALGMYIAERNNSSFKNTFINFDHNPQFMRIDDKLSFEKRVRSVYNAPWGGNTDFEKAYMLLLNMARTFNVKKEDMPTIILVLSDMQFDEASCNRVTHFENIRLKFEENGYNMPKLVFWNLHAHEGSPARARDNNVALVSGYSPSIMKAVLANETFNPVSVMMEAIKDIELNYSSLPETLEV